jgi:5-methylcytosine-specific restriction endonuclease McrA
MITPAAIDRTPMTLNQSPARWRRPCAAVLATLLTAAASLGHAKAPPQTTAWRCDTDAGVVYSDRACAPGAQAGRKVEAVINVVRADPAGAGAGTAPGAKRRDAAPPRAGGMVVVGRPGAATEPKNKANSPQDTAKKPKPLRNPKAVAAFRKLKPCPSTRKTQGACPGYEIDHIVPLAAGGADAPHNMQWLTRQQHRAKTKREREACVYGCRP